MASFLSQEYRIPTVQLAGLALEAELLALVSYASCVRHRVIPVQCVGRSLIVAMADPIDEAALDALRSETGLVIEPVIASERAIRAAIETYRGGLR